MDRRTEVELTRLQGEYRMRRAEAVMAFQYGDHVRSIWCGNEAAKIKGRMARIRAFGYHPTPKKNRKAFAKEYDRLYGPCEDLCV